MAIDKLTGTIISEYEVQQLLGKGAMGVVYRAFQPKLNRYVAMKILSDHLTDSGEHQQRFLREAQTLATLEHPHIVPIHDFGTANGITFVVMRLLEGGTLSHRMKNTFLEDAPPLTIREVFSLLKAIASALDYAHSKNVIHRDVKAGNIMFDSHDHPFLTDFGLAKLLDSTQTRLTHDGAAMGTPAYMSPEQWRGNALTPAADQYSLAVLVYELLTGRPPFSTDSLAMLMFQHLNEPVPPAHFVNQDLPETLSVILQKAMAKRASDRFPTASAFAEAFGDVLQGKAVTILPIEFVPMNPNPTPPNAAYVVGTGESELATLQLAQSDTALTLPQVVYRLPAPPPDFFHDRESEMAQLGRFVRSQQVLCTIIGRGGVGKTGLVCHFFKALESGKLPDSNALIPLQGIVYLSWRQRTLNENALYEGLCRLLPDSTAENFRQMGRDPHISIEARYTDLLDQFRADNVLILMDNLEDVLDSGTDSHPFIEKGLLEALQAILTAPPHPVKVVITSRIKPTELLKSQPSRQRLIDLHEGLPHPYAERYLKDLDESGSLGLQDRPDADPILQIARERTRGNPRALEAIIGILRTDDTLDLEALIEKLTLTYQGEVAEMLPDDVTAALVAEAFNRLDLPAQQVMQALAVYNRAVPAEALSAVLQGFVAEQDLLPILRRLINMRFVQVQGETYALHPIDRTYAFARIPTEGTDEFSQRGLLLRGAAYFEQTRKPEAEWKTLDDLAPQLAEIDLRVKAGQFTEAADVLQLIAFDYLLVWGYLDFTKEAYLRLIHQIQDPTLESKCLGQLGLAYYRLGDFQNAIHYYERATQVCIANNNIRGTSAHIGNLGNVYRDLGDLPKAIDHYEKALAVAREYEIKSNIPLWLGSLGTVYHRMGDLTKAIDYFEQSLVIANELQNDYIKSVCLGNLGNVYADRGDFTQAIAYHEQTLAIDRAIGDKLDETHDLYNLGEVHLNQGDIAAAILYFTDALTIADSISYHENQHHSRWGLAEAHFIQGKFNTAHTFLQAALTYPYPQNMPLAYALLGLVHLHESAPSSAREAFQTALDEAKALLTLSPNLHKVWDAQTLAEAGMALVAEGRSTQQTAIEAALVSYHHGRGLMAAAGYVGVVRRRLDYLTPLDTDKVLGPIRAVLDGATPKD